VVSKSDVDVGFDDLCFISDYSAGLIWLKLEIGGIIFIQNTGGLLT